MTSDQIALLVPLAMGLIASPVPLAELVVILIAQGRVRNSILFITFQGIFLIIGLVAGSYFSKSLATLPSVPSSIQFIIELILGVTLVIGGAIYATRKRSAPSQSQQSNSKRIHTGTVIFLALSATLANPVNLPLILAAGHVINTYTATEMLSAALFLLVSLMPFIFIVLIGIAGGAKSAQLLHTLRVWLMKHSHTINVIFFEILGICLILIAFKSM
ncbi:GAP family protein [Aurantimicrobium minutum]|uniref:GAP family protein n=1 Tax=Aurantimicrobium minutum TaxID=708131 RepID=UPI0024743B98|nr:GAP family protein [Aurantimicrobium minutum]MDH6422284.1 membrane protein implicated in regulation of membrane protease activity [Aurantimicrobium minutum]